MKKEYTKPEIEIKKFSTEDIITASSTTSSMTMISGEPIDVSSMGISTVDLSE